MVVADVSRPGTGCCSAMLQSRTDGEEDGEGDGAQTSCPQPPKGGSSVKRSNHGICRDVASLTQLPHPALERVASFSDGPSMYSLALTAKHPFFSGYFAVDSVRGTAFATRLLSIAVRGQLSSALALRASSGCRPG